MKKREPAHDVDALEFYYENGYFDEYSEDHFLMKLLNGEAELPAKFQESIFQHIIDNGTRVSFDNLSFKLSFSARLANMFNLFDKADIDKFLKRQLPSGKIKYDENQFFQALSEVSCINYVANILPDSEHIECEYEPKTNGDRNPEARIVSGKENLSTFSYDIEVKTGKFDEIPIVDGKRYVKLNIPLKKEELNTINSAVKQLNYNLISPNFHKIKDFIKSAHNKFIEPIDENHINVLFINWTFIEPKTSKLMEPFALLYGDKIGVLKSNVLHSLIGISEDDLSNISAIVVYRDNYDSIISLNMLSAVNFDNCKIMINDKYGINVDREKVLSELRIPEVKTAECSLFELWGNTYSGNMEDYLDGVKMAEICVDIINSMIN